MARSGPIAASHPLGLERDGLARLLDLLRIVVDPTRLQILAILYRSDGPVCSCELPPARFGIGQPTLSYHVTALRSARLVCATKRPFGRLDYRLCSSAAPLVEAILRLASSAQIN